jgi:hypothetical protein
MELLLALGDTGLARALRGSGTAYLVVNAAHVLGIALLLGAILPLDARLIGAFRTVPLPVIGPFLSRTAGAGLLLAVATGLALFSVNPPEYLTNPAFRWKLALIAVAVLNLALLHQSGAFRRALAGQPVAPGLRAAAVVSALTWLGALLAGRWIGFL